MQDTSFAPVETIESFMIDVFEALGTPADDARTCADVLITSDLRGIESHGVGRLKYYYDRIQAGLHLSLIHISEPTRQDTRSRIPSSA